MAVPTVAEVLAWANEVCTQALTESRNGDTSLSNRLGANSAMQLFYNNAHLLKSVPATSFPAYYAPQWKEITRLYEEYMRDEQINQSVDKVSALEDKVSGLDARFDKFEAMLTAFIESQKPADEKPAKKTGKQTKAKVEEAEAADVAEDDAKEE